MAAKKKVKLNPGMHGFRRFIVHASDFIIASALFALLFMYSAEKPELCNSSERVVSALDCLIVTFAENLSPVIFTLLISLGLSLFINCIFSFLFGGTIGMLGMGYQYKKTGMKNLLLYFLLNRLELIWGAFGTWKAIFSIDSLSSNEKICGLVPISLNHPAKKK